MAVLERVKRTVWVRFGGCCAICRERLLMDTTSGRGSHLVGEVAHIVAEQLDGPRGNAPLTAEQRNQEENLLLLCLAHHKVIDDDPSGYPVSELHRIRTEHLAWVAERLRCETPWRTKLHNFYYINVPRLNLLAATAGESLDLSGYGDIIALHELGWDLNGLMLGFKQLLAQVELKAIELEEAVGLGHKARGLLVSFDDEFRTKNIKMPESITGYRNAVKGNIKSDPHIYKMVDDVKIFLSIDPRWVATTTAFVQFRPSGGKGRFAGLGVINACDHETKFMSITPLVIGLPSNPFLETLYSSAGARTIDA